LKAVLDISREISSRKYERLSLVDFLNIRYRLAYLSLHKNLNVLSELITHGDNHNCPEKEDLKDS